MSGMDLDAVRGSGEAEVMLPDDAAYAAATRAWNARFGARPAAVIRCHGTAAVRDAVRFAVRSRLPVSVRGGGHSYPGHTFGDDAVALDLSLLNEVRVDPAARRVRVQAGARWGAVDAATQRSSLATTGATVSTVGVGGHALGGGTGYLARYVGLAVDNLVAADVVTADGNIVRASESENEDLFWALRGGGGNFGVVTSFDFRLHEIGPTVTTAQAFYGIDAASDVMRAYRAFMDAAPDDVTAYLIALRVPPVDPFPREAHGAVALAIVACHCGDPELGAAALAPLVTFARPLLSGIQAVDYVAAQQAFDAGMPAGLRWATEAHALSGLDDAALDTFLAFARSLPGSHSMAYLEPLGGAIARVPPSATAFPHRDAPCSLHILPGWTDAADDDTCIAWAREFHAAMAPFSTGGVYVNLMNERPELGAASAYGGNLTRLREIKRTYDPLNTFRFNHNIVP
jgi:FAD/FMN-containing dehydrogenase